MTRKATLKSSKANPLIEDRPATKDAVQGQPYGSTLGIIDSDPNAKLPWTPADHGGNPKGIDVRSPATGTGDLRPAGLSMTTDMGAAGDGNETSDETSGRRRGND